jgi:hypothetical protein
MSYYPFRVGLYDMDIKKINTANERKDFGRETSSKNQRRTLESPPSVKVTGGSSGEEDR